MNWTTYNSAGAALSQSLTDMPVGTITGYAGTTAPSGWLLCDGAAVSRTTYAELFGVVGTTYGSGDGSTTFNVPDSSGFIILASSQAARLAAAALPQYVTSLPSSPVDGQTVVYAADATNGVMWTLRYRAASSSSYKWEFVGGASLRAIVDTEQQNTTTGWQNLATAGPSVTLPLAGDYKIEAYTQKRVTDTGGQATGIGIATGDTTPGNEDAAFAHMFYYANAQDGYIPIELTTVKTGQTANTTWKIRYYQWYSSSNHYWRNRRLFVTPVRVG